MKSEFQKILESHIARESSQKKECPAAFTEDLMRENFIKIDLEPKRFGLSSYKVNISGIHEKRKLGWISEVNDADFKEAIELFYELGARQFLSRKPIDIKRDFKKLVFEWHPDRCKMRAFLSENAIHERFLLIMKSYQKLVSKSENA